MTTLFFSFLLFFLPLLIFIYFFRIDYIEFGQWSYSTAGGAYGTSRYAYLHQSPPAWASFTTRLNRSGIYDFSEIVPVTVNAAKNAIYVLSISGVPIDSFYVDQNEGSGVWKTIGRSFLPSNVPIEMRVMDSGENTPGAVLRADAVKFSLVKEITEAKNLAELPKEFLLHQNYPNPFNPSTTIKYQIPKAGLVRLKVYDILGREIATLVDEFQSAGEHTVLFSSDNKQQTESRNQLSSGIYFYRISTGTFVAVKKMILLK